MWERKAKVITMSKSVSETLKEQGVILTDAPNFEATQETTEKTRVEKAIELTNQRVSNKCRKAFNKFVKKYKLEIDFEKYEGKTDELMELVNAVATDDEDASLVRHMKSYCKSVLKNLSKLPKEDVITGINGGVISEKEVKEFIGVIAKEANFSKSEKKVFDSLKDSLISGLLDTMREVDADVEKLVGDARKEWLVSRLVSNMKKYSDYSETEIHQFVKAMVDAMDEMDGDVPEAKIKASEDDGVKKRAEIEAVMKQMQEEEAKEEADKVSMTSKPEDKIESVPTTSVTKKTTTRYIEKEPKMTEYRKAGKINQYFDDLKIWQQQYTA